MPVGLAAHPYGYISYGAKFLSTNFEKRLDLILAPNFF
jgi:hypothetical protein